MSTHTLSAAGMPGPRCVGSHFLTLRRLVREARDCRYRNLPGLRRRKLHAAQACARELRQEHSRAVVRAVARRYPFRPMPATSRPLTPLTVVLDLGLPNDQTAVHFRAA